MKRLSLAVAVTIGLGATAPAPAGAKSDKTVVYAVEKVFPAAVRFLRVDEGVKITEKDADAGYVMFELAQDGKTFPGALELVVAESSGRPAVKLVLRIEDRPSYVETAMLERLERKLRAELGSEPPPVKKTEPREEKPPQPTPPTR
ncbi:MAG: hypothetical protein F9K40_04565 [Kofleriaceae bacterium]|nr:MAG: hypothetical protein F9K40_04565 [Kofleriaceae bacterium]MBZ0235101.1 hypothetical protein [Kofleriaceae bacterium]